MVRDFLTWWLMRKYKKWPEPEIGRTLKGLLSLAYVRQDQPLQESMAFKIGSHTNWGYKRSKH